MTSVICICNKRACDRQRQSYGERMVVISSWAPVVSVGTHRQNTQRAQFCGASEFYGHRHQSVYQTAQTDTHIYIYILYVYCWMRWPGLAMSTGSTTYIFGLAIWQGHLIYGKPKRQKKSVTAAIAASDLFIDNQIYWQSLWYKHIRDKHAYRLNRNWNRMKVQWMFLYSVPRLKATVYTMSHILIVYLLYMINNDHS